MAENSGKESKFNPYAPPLCNLTADRLYVESVAKDPQIVVLLDELERSPVVASSYIEEFVGSAGRPASASKVAEDFGIISKLAFLLLLALLLVPATRMVGVLLFLFLVGVRVIQRVKRQNPESKTCVSPAGIYVWLITDGGVLITTPASAQWGIPWSRIAKIAAIPGGWCLETCADPPKTWHMPSTGIRSQDAELFLKVAQFLSHFTQENRPHPILGAESVQWSDQRIQVTGKNWTVLHDGARTWCEIRGLVCDLPNSQTTTTASSLLIEDFETGWTCYLERDSKHLGKQPLIKNV